VGVEGKDKIFCPIQQSNTKKKKKKHFAKYKTNTRCNILAISLKEQRK